MKNLVGIMYQYMECSQVCFWFLPKKPHTISLIYLKKTFYKSHIGLSGLGGKS